MPLINAARRTRRNREEGNPFATARVVIEERIDELTTAYLRCRNSRIVSLLKVEIELLEALI